MNRVSQAWRQEVEGMPRTFWFLAFGMLVNRIGYVVQPFLALYLTGERGVSTAVAGTILSCFGIGAVLSQPLGGYLADRWGRRRTLVLGMLCSAGTTALIPFMPGLVAVGLVVAAYGLAIDLYRPAVAALVADSVVGADRARAFGLLYWAANMGSAVAGLLGGVLAKESFNLVFALSAVTCVAFALIAARFVPERRGRAQVGGDGRFAVLRDRLLLAVTGSFLVFAVIAVQAFVTLPVVMRADGFGPAAYGVVFASNAVVIMVVQPLASRRIARLPTHTAYAGAILLTGIGFSLTAFAHVLAMYVATVVIWTFGEIGVAMLGPALVAEIAPPNMQGRYNGVFGSAFGAASLLGPAAGASVLQYVGPGALWGGCLVLGALSAALVATLGPAVRVRRAAANLPPAPSVSGRAGSDPPGSGPTGAAMEPAAGSIIAPPETSTIPNTPD